MIVRRAFPLAAALLALTACSPCFGGPGCEYGQAIVSASGKMIEHKSGKGVGNVTLRFVRTNGLPIQRDTLIAVSNDDGFFRFEVVAASDTGTVVGDLTITPRAPRPAFVVPGFELKATRQRGDGQILGSLVVNPYLILVGEVRDRRNGNLAEGARVAMRVTSGPPLPGDSIVFYSDLNGRFSLELSLPTVEQFTANFKYSLEAFPRPYEVDIPLRAEAFDNRLSFITLKLGRKFTYVAEVHRRGTLEHLPGVTVEYRRVSGIEVLPPVVSMTPNSAGFFGVDLDPQADGEVVGDLVIYPPAPFPVEVHPDVRLRTYDDDVTRVLGLFGYGPHAFFKSKFQYRATGGNVPAGTLVTSRWVGGLTQYKLPSAAADTGVRVVDSNGELRYFGATTDSGQVQFEIDVLLPAPHKLERLRNVFVPARYNDAPVNLGTLPVGMWYPGTGQVEDFDTAEPIVNAQVSFQRTAGGSLASNLVQSTSDSAGTFPVRPVPLDSGTVTGTLTIFGAPLYRDTTITDIQLRTSQNDTLRTVGTYRLKRLP